MSEGNTTGRLRALHRALAARPNEPVLFADLVREDWGENPPTGPLPALRTLVKRLRRSIPDEIVTDASGYRLKVRTPGPCQLPADLPDFVGREHELQRLERAEEGMVAITGAPGVGKTALAVRLAHRLRERYFDGQLYVNLRAFASGPPVLRSPSSRRSAGSCGRSAWRRRRSPRRSRARSRCTRPSSRASGSSSCSTTRSRT